MRTTISGRQRIKRAFGWSIFFLALLAVPPTGRGADLAQAEALFRASKWAEAREAYQALLPGLAGNERARVLNAIGYTYQAGQQPPEAITEYRRALATDGINPEQQATALVRLGGCLNLTRQYAEAYQELSKVRQIEGAPPDQVMESCLVAATSCLKLDDQEKALAVLQQAATVEGAAGHYYATALMNRGSIYQQAKAYDQALVEFRKVVAHPAVSPRQRSWAETNVAELEAILAGDDPFYIKPYVLRVTADGAEVNWISLGELGPGEVTVTATDHTVQTNSAVSAIRDTVCERQVATFTGLRPNTRYRYRVDCAGQQQEGSFKTAPVDAAAPVTFAVLGDTQAAPDLHQQVGAAIANDHPDFVIHVGDLTDRGATWGKWRTELFDPGWTYLRDSFFVPTVGNHDGGHFYPTLFGMKGRMYYSFDYGTVHVTVIDSYWSGGANRPRQLQWLADDLAGSTATWKIVSLHLPIVSTRSEPECEWFGRTDYLPLLEKHGVDVVLSGHQPMYKRYRPIGPPGAKPIIHITSGGGGPVGDPVPGPLLVKGAGSCHHSFFRIQGNTLEMKAVLPDGTVIDRLTLVKQDGRYQREVMDAAVPADLAYRVRNLYQELLTDRTHVLEAEFDAPPEPGSPMKIHLDTRRLPRGPLDTSALPAAAKLVIGQQPGNPWKIPTQELDLQQPVLEFTATAPADASVTGDRIEPAFEAVIQLKVGDRVFEPYAATVRPATRSPVAAAATP